MFQDYKIAYLRKHVKVKEVQPLSFLRQSVAYLLSQTARNAPQAAIVVQFDVTNLVEYGKERDEAFANGTASEKALFRRAMHRNFSAFFIKAFAHSLHHVPCMNGFLDYTFWRNGGTLYRAEDINLSFTVHTNFGVLRPIVRNPHLKTLEEVAQETRDLARKARRTDPEKLFRAAARAYLKTAVRQLDFGGLDALWMLVRSTLWPRFRQEPAFTDVPPEKQLKVTDILGATCTIANIGMMVPGNQTVTVIIPPEVMMFGIGDLHLAPRVVEGKVVPRYVITVTGTMDHRAFDAGEAFPIHQHLRRYFNDPKLLYEWKHGDPI